MSNKIEKELFQMADEKYLEFHRSLLNDDIDIIGVRMPKLRAYAKRLSKENSLDYWINKIEDNYYEEILLKGLLIGLAKDLVYSELEKYIRYFVPKITNWAVCDTFCNSLKITKKYSNEMWKLVQEYLKCESEFDVRFALVMILNYYIDDDHIEQIYKIINSVNKDDYYIKMANAWLISYCFIKYYDKTLYFYKKRCTIDEWTYNKGIQKSLESYRLSEEQKNILKKLKK